MNMNFEDFNLNDIIQRSFIDITWRIDFMEYCKLQIGCLAVLFYILLSYLRGYKSYNWSLRESFFDELLVLAILCVSFDCATAYTVNHLDTVNPFLNLMLHLLFLLCIDSVVFGLFVYVLHITDVHPQRRIVKFLVLLPFVVNIIAVVLNIGSLEYIHGVYTNYSMGISVYTCFSMVILYTLMTVIVFFTRIRHIESHKRRCIIIYVLVSLTGMTIQFFNPEYLITSIGVTVMILGIYLSYEDPALKELSEYYSETVMSFANLVENRDSSTGDHIKRTTQYVRLIAQNLQKRGYYKDILTKDFISDMEKAAPLHDIGKISVPDAVLQKPGRLTDEEFAVMKKHAENGGTIIRESFEKLGNDEYTEMAYEVARYHHEKWNGRGYPEGLSGEKIPLCARIMAVADVFDAVSEKRCYRDAMPLEQCFDIIRKGTGEDFDPLIAKVFLEIKDAVEEVHRSFAQNK